jgi:hypothetical protein
VRKRCFWCVMYSYAIICTLLHIYHIISLYIYIISIQLCSVYIYDIHYIVI